MIHPSAVASRALQTARWHRSKAVVARMHLVNPRLPPLTSNTSSFACHDGINRTASSSNDVHVRLFSSTPVGASNNFVKMLHYQTGPSSPPPKQSRKERRRAQTREEGSPQQAGNGKVTSFQQFSSREASSQQNDSGALESNEMAAISPPRDNSNHRKATASWRENARRSQHWRNKNKNKRTRSFKQLKERDAEFTPRKPMVAVSEWIKVSYTPQSSKLSDLFPSLNQIFDHELQKGIIDLDALDDINKDADDVTLKELDEIGASELLYTTEKIDRDNSSIPLWTPSPSDQPQSHEGGSPIVLEARVNLNQSAKPVGWFLRLPNRSVVHAILNHVRKGWSERHQQWNHRNTTNELRQQRKKWREGLWRGVYMDRFGAPGREEEIHVAMEEKELMWGDGLVEDDEVSDDVSEENEGADESALSNSQDEVVGTTQVRSEDNEDDIDNYLQEYSKFNPYPSQSTDANDNPTYSHHILKCGSNTLNVREFSPDPSYTPAKSNGYQIWDQYAFHLSPLLNLSDSVVRVETSRLRTSAQDIQYMFRGYDLAAIFPVEEDSTVVPACAVDYPKSLGWNIDMKGNADVLVEGTYEHQHNSDGAVPRAKRHTFLVRFASSADARMAVRDNGDKDSRFLSLAQYPQQL